MRFPHLSSIHRHATVIVGSCIGIRVKILANARDTSRLVHRFFIDDTSLHDNDEERHYHNVVLRLVVSVISIIFRRKKKKKNSFHCNSFQGGEILQYEQSDIHDSVLQNHAVRVRRCS